jgi:uncharacterized protein
VALFYSYIRFHERMPQLKKFLAPLFFLIASFASPLAFAESHAFINSISISGRGEVSAVPDIVDITISIESTAKKAGEAMQTNKKSMKALFDTIGNLGIPDKDVATTNFKVDQQFEYSNEGKKPPKVVGYEVTNTVRVRLRKVEKMGEFLDLAVKDGASTIRGLSFSISETGKLLDEARKQAMEDARRKAEVYAKSGGFTLGKVMTVVEGGGVIIPLRPAVSRKLASSAEESVPVAEGEQQLSIDVNVVWEIK